MREILFRGKRLDNGEWVYGHYTPSMNARSYVTTDKIYKYDASIVFVGNDQYATFAKVNEETVGQYTGLTDKNGKKIFEGDIVEGCDYDEEDGYGVVEWHDGAFYVHNGSLCGTFFDNYRGKDFEVIGNIYDNPNLLGGAADD